MSGVLYATSRWLLRGLQRLAGGVASHGPERMPGRGPVIVAANHTSYLDPIMVGLGCGRPLHFMARATLFRDPFFAWAIRAHHAFPVERAGDPRAALRAFGERLDRGEAVLMFPEGTRSPTGRLGEVKGGVGLLAVRHRAPVVPVYAWGTHQGWPAGGRWRPHPVRLFFGAAIEPGPDSRESQRRITEATHAALSALEREALGQARP